MKNRILGFFATLLIIFFVTGCGMLSRIFHHRNSNDTEIIAGSVQSMYVVNYDFNSCQLDSLCKADNIPSNLSDSSWTRKTYTDFETGKPVVRYMYIMELNDNTEMIYFVTPRGEMFVVSKRKVVTEE